MDHIILSQEERDHFATWLEQQAESDNEMVKQMGKLSPLAQQVTERFRMRVAAYTVVSTELRHTEDMAISDTSE